MVIQYRLFFISLSLILSGCDLLEKNDPRPDYSTPAEKMCTQLIAQAAKKYRSSKSDTLVGVQAKPYFEKLVGLDCNYKKISFLLMEKDWFENMKNQSLPSEISITYRLTTTRTFGLIQDRYDKLLITWDKSGKIINVKMGFGGGYMTEGTYD